MELKYDAGKNILYGSYAGAFTLDEFEEQLIHIVSGANFPATVPTIWDLSAMDFSQFDWEFMKKLLEIRAKFPSRGNALIAIVAEDDLAFGVSRMYASQGISLPQTLQVFRRLEEAETWILDNSTRR